MTPLSMWKNKYAVSFSEKSPVSQVSFKELKMLSWLANVSLYYLCS